MADQDDNEQTPAVPEPQEAPADAGADAARRCPGAGEAHAAAPPDEQRRSKRVGRIRARSTSAAWPAGPRTPEERQAERDALRKVKAARRRHQRLKDRAKAAERQRAAPRRPQSRLRPCTRWARARRKLRQGVVVSDKASKTITVRVDVVRRHRRYEKIVRSSIRLHAHDEDNQAHVGDTVRVQESRPLSATKRWRLVDVLERAR